jgi:hypothetical protein
VLRQDNLLCRIVLREVLLLLATNNSPISNIEVVTMLL